LGSVSTTKKKSDCREKLEGGRISEIEKLGDRLEYLLIKFQTKKIKKLLYALYLMVLSSSNLSTGHVAFRYQ
jgi:hypothetical protein